MAICSKGYAKNAQVKAHRPVQHAVAHQGLSTIDRNLLNGYAKHSQSQANRPIEHACAQQELFTIESADTWNMLVLIENCSPLSLQRPAFSRLPFALYFNKLLSTCDLAMFS